MGRAPCCDKANVKRGPWSPEEDTTLKSFIEKHGTGGNWITLPHKIGLKRCGKSCRLRWLNYLRPNIKHGGFTEDEDNLICSLYVSIGSRWSIIAAQLPGRTDNDIKNYWNTKLKKKLLGRQRREQRETASSKRSVQDYHSINNMNLSLYNNNEVTQTQPDINNVSMMLPPFESRFDYDQPQINIYNTSDHDHPQHLDFKGMSSRSTLPANDLQAFDEIQQDDPVMYRVGQLYGVENLSAVDMVNCCAVSPESAGRWGAMTDLLVHPSALSSYQVCQIKMPQDFSFLISQGY